MSPRVNGLGAMGLTCMLWLGSAGTANAEFSIGCEGDAYVGNGLGGDDCDSMAGALNKLDGVSGLECGGNYPFLYRPYSYTSCSKVLPALNKLVNASHGDANSKIFCDGDYAFLYVMDCSVAAKLSAVLQGTCKHGNAVSGPKGGGICTQPCNQGWHGSNCDSPGFYACNSSTYQCVQVAPGGGANISSCLKACIKPPTPPPPTSPTPPPTSPTGTPPPTYTPSNDATCWKYGHNEAACKSALAKSEHCLWDCRAGCQCMYMPPGRRVR